MTAVRLMTGLCASASFVVGEASWWRWGAGLFLLSMLLDRADGDLARLTGQSSGWRHKFDLVSDCLCDALIFVGLGVGLRAGQHGVYSIPMGVVAGIAAALVFWLVMRVENLAGPRSAELSGILGFDADDAMLVVPISVYFGFQEPLLLAAAVAAPVFFVMFYLLSRPKLSRSEMAFRDNQSPGGLGE